MASSEFSRQYYNWPDAIESKIPYLPPHTASNPVIKGLVLASAAPLVENLSFVAKFLYKNAGFSSLRKLKAIRDIKCRYDPTVCPIQSLEIRNLPVPNHTDPQLEVRSLLQSTPAGDEPMYWGVRDYHAAYKSGEITPTQMVNALLPLIRRDVERRSEHSTAFLFTKVDIVLAAAEASTKRWAEGKSLGLLDGVPVAMKDDLNLAGYPQVLGSKRTIHESGKATSWGVAKWEEQGAIVVGKTNMHECGMDTTNNNFVHGTPKNPYNDRYYTGGSSGGSAYAVSTGLVAFAAGTDAAGSVRIPSNYCGLFGLKTSHSRVSMDPTPDVAGTTCVTGPLAATMENLEIAFRVMATPNPLKHVSATFPYPRRLTTPRKKLLGLPRQWIDQADPEVRARCYDAIEWLVDSRGYETVDISIPLLHEGHIAHALTILSEVRNEFANTKFMQPANRILMAIAATAPTTDFLSAQKVRGLIMSHISHLWEMHGKDMIIVTPTTPNAGWHFTAADLKKGISNADMTLKSVSYAWLANSTGCPCLQFPVGYVKPEVGKGDIPVGIQGMGIWGSDDELIEWGYEGEKYLHEVVKGGRIRSPKWVDVIALAKAGEEKPKAVSVNPTDSSVKIVDETEPVNGNHTATTNGMSREKALAEKHVPPSVTSTEATAAGTETTPAKAS